MEIKQETGREEGTRVDIEIRQRMNVSIYRQTTKPSIQQTCNTFQYQLQYPFLTLQQLYNNQSSEMLKFEDFQPIDKSYTEFKFQQLSLVGSASSVNPVYCDEEGHKYSYMEVDSMQQLKMIDSIAKNGILLNYRGALGKDGKLFGFYAVQQYANLENYVDKLMTRNDRVDERFCIEYFQSFIIILLEIQKHGLYLKLINPFIIGLRNPESQTNVGFGLLLPFPCKYFNCILKQEYEQNIKFIAPEIIRHFVSNPGEELCQKQFRKASLYSLGLVLLFCFGYTFTSKQRIEASKNDKEFRNNFKKIRKQIKLLHNGKFVPKALKLLLEDCEKSRQIIQTFSIKIKSPQFDLLKICKNVNINEYRFFSTICDSNKSDVAKSQKTINIEINQNSSPLTLTPISNKTPILKLQQNMNSPINIEVSYGDEAAQSIWLSKANKQRIVRQEILENSMEVNHQEEDGSKEKKVQQGECVESMMDEKIEQAESIQVYCYNGANERKIGRSKDNNFEIQQDSMMVEVPQFGEQQDFDSRSILRRRFQNESKVIMAAILFIFFLYGVVGYIRQNS